MAVQIHWQAYVEKETTVTLVTCPQLLWKSKPPRGEPYSDPVRTLNTKLFSLEDVSDQCFIGVKYESESVVLSVYMGYTSIIQFIQ